MLTIKEETANAIIEDIKSLQGLLTDQIQDLHQMKGGIPMRHSYIYYREILKGISNALVTGLKEVKNDKSK